MKTCFFIVCLLICVGLPSCDTGNKKSAERRPSSLADPVFDSLKNALSYGDSGTEAATVPAVPATVGDTVINGVYTYRVDKVTFSRNLRSGSMTVAADGFFLRLFLVVSNQDSQPHALDKSLIKLVDADNRTYACSGPATDILAMNGEKNLCNGTCNPKETIVGAMIFDVPSNSMEYRLQVSNGAWKAQIKEILLTNLREQTSDSL